VVEAVADPNAEPTTADGFARRAAMRLGRHDGPGAIDDFSKAIDLSPDAAAYYRDRARAYGESGKGALASADIDKALALDPKDSDLLLARARIRFRAKDREGARADAEAAAALIPPTSLDMIPAAGMLTELGAPDRAIALLDPVIASHRDDARLGRLLNGRCWARAVANRDLDLAVADCNGAIRRDGPKPQYLDSRGMAWFRKGDMAHALADFDAVLKAEPSHANSLYMRGLVHARMGDAAAGKADLDAASAARPDIADRIASYGIKQ
jgi:tetratricopeptide (TPR) repeat protein